VTDSGAPGRGGSPATTAEPDGPGLIFVRAGVRRTRAAEFAAWYDREHLPYATQNLPGIEEARRYELVRRDHTSATEPDFLITYFVDDVQNVQRAFDGPAMRAGIREYDARWGTDSVRTRAGYREVSRHEGTKAC
jgi:hypothetical protein